MQINPQSQRVYLSSDSLYWISDGDCKRCRLDEHPDCTEPRHIIVSEYWMRREILPAQKDRHRSCRPGFDFFDFVEDDCHVQMCASLRSQGFELLTNLFNYDNLQSVTPESDWICHERLDGMFAWHCESKTTACVVANSQVVRVGLWSTSESHCQLAAWAKRIGTALPKVQSISPEALLSGQFEC